MDEAQKFYFQGFAVPDYMQEGLKRYVEDRIPAGSFLSAVLANNLVEAVGMADVNNMANLPAYANYLYNYAPSDCWGSPEKVKAWLVGGKDEA